jgi:hypothetical protein
MGMMTFFTYIIALMPEVAARLRKEISEVVGMDGEVDKNGIRDMKICEPGFVLQGEPAGANEQVELSLTRLCVSSLPYLSSKFFYFADS